MAKVGRFEQILNLVAHLTNFLPDLPFLLLDWVAEVTVSLDQSFHDKFAFANDIERRRVLADVIQCRPFSETDLLGSVIEVNEADSVELREEGDVAKKF